MKRIMLGMSGGVDSTYAAIVLQKAGYEVEGAVLAMHSYTEIEEARESAGAVGIPLHVFHAEDLFEEYVINDFCKAYRSGQTPNPCIICNETVKFRVLFDRAMELGFDGIATGHYAKIMHHNGRYAVGKAADVSKDQSYMLYRLPQEILQKLIFPLGEYIKKDVSADASTMALRASNRAESQEICFVKNESYADYIEKRCGRMPVGNFVDVQGSVLGEHKGIVHYTLGQRKGLGISAATRLFVQQILPQSNTVVLSDQPLRTKSFLINDVVFSGLTLDEAIDANDLMVKVRYLAKPIRATLARENEHFWRVELQEAIGAITPGQSAVFYQGETVAFGGIIRKVGNNG